MPDTRRRPILRDERDHARPRRRRQGQPRPRRGLFLEELGNEALEPLGDSAVARDRGRAGWPSRPTRYVVRPLFFPGGDIGELAVNGTVNDLAVAGARRCGSRPGSCSRRASRSPTCARIVASMATAARAAGRRGRRRRHQGRRAGQGRRPVRDDVRASACSSTTSPWLRARAIPGDRVLAVRARSATTAWR